MSAWLSKWAPASGVLAAVLVAIAFFASPKAPGDNATGAQVIAWYNSHNASDFASDLIGGVAVLLLVLFAVALVRQVRTGDRWLAYGALAGAVFGGVGFLTSVGFDSVLAQNHNHLTAASAQTLNLLENDFFLPIFVGFALFGILPPGRGGGADPAEMDGMGHVRVRPGLPGRSHRVLRHPGHDAVGPGGRDLDGQARPAGP